MIGPVTFILQFVIGMVAGPPPGSSRFWMCLGFTSDFRDAVGLSMLLLVPVLVPLHLAGWL